MARLWRYSALGGAPSSKAPESLSPYPVPQSAEPINTMRSIAQLSLLVLLPLAVSQQATAAEVFKCTTADGKTSYSATPCTAAGAKEVVVPIVTGPMASPPQNRDWAAENAALNARAQAAEASRVEAAAQNASAAAKNAEEIVAECEANRGINCNSDKEVAKRRSDDRTLTPEEAAALHRASAGRQKNERDAAAAANPPKPAPPAPSPAPVPPPGSGATAPSKT